MTIPEAEFQVFYRATPWNLGSLDLIHKMLKEKHSHAVGYCPR